MSIGGFFGTISNNEHCYERASKHRLNEGFFPQCFEQEHQNKF
jgi:hypothetical protein